MGAIDETRAKPRTIRADARRIAVALAVAALPPSHARADDLAALFEPGTVVSLGGFSGTGGRFQGARAIGPWGLPYASFRKADERPEWFSPDDALDVALVDGQGIAGGNGIADGQGIEGGTGIEGGLGFQGGAVLDFRSGRSVHADRALAGLPRLPVAVGLGVFGEVWPVDDVLRLRAEVTQGVRAHDGIVAKLSADLVGTAGRFTLSGGPRLVLGDAAAMRLDFDVPPAAARVNPRLTPYRAAGGPRSVGAILALAYEWSEAWQTLGSVRYDRLVASAAASPIVRRVGTANDVTIGIGAIYSFRLAR